MPHIYGLSVQYAPGQNSTLKELALAGRILNGSISYALVDELVAAVLPLGYTVRLIQSPGFGFHHTLCIVYDANAGHYMCYRVMLQRHSAQHFTASPIQPFSHSLEMTHDEAHIR